MSEKETMSEEDIMDIGSGPVVEDSKTPAKPGVKILPSVKIDDSETDTDPASEIFAPADVAGAVPEEDQKIEIPVSMGHLPKLKGRGFPEDYLALYRDVLQNYSDLPVIDYPNIYAQLRELNIQANPVPTPQIISQEISKVQGYKDRMSEIYIMVQRNYFLKKRLVDVLKDSWFKYSSEKSADKRKSDGIIRTSEFESDFAKIETLFRVANHIIKNLDSVHESLSRRFSVMQFELKLHEAGRMAPDWNFDREVQNNPFDEEGKGDEIDADFDPSKGIDAEEEGF